jgi:hypothetical protein
MKLSGAPILQEAGDVTRRDVPTNSSSYFLDLSAEGSYRRNYGTSRLVYRRPRRPKAGHQLT